MSVSHYVRTHLAASAQGVPVDSRYDGFPHESDIAPPFQEVLFVVTLEVPILHLLDISTSSEGLTVSAVSFL